MFSLFKHYRETEDLKAANVPSVKKVLNIVILMLSNFKAIRRKRESANMLIFN